MKNKALHRLILRRYKGIYKGKFGTIFGAPTFNQPKTKYTFTLHGETIPNPINFCQQINFKLNINNN